MIDFKCDYLGKCQNKPYREVYPSLSGKKHKDRGWSYLCRKHYNQEFKRFKGKLPSCRAESCDNLGFKKKKK